MKIREHGIEHREKSRVFRSRPKCDSDGKNFGSVRLIDCYAAILVLVYGLFASFVMFCAENISKINMRKKCGSIMPTFDEFQ